MRDTGQWPESQYSCCQNHYMPQAIPTPPCPLLPGLLSAGYRRGKEGARKTHFIAVSFPGTKQGREEQKGLQGG